MDERGSTYRTNSLFGPLQNHKLKSKGMTLVLRMFFPADFIPFRLRPLWEMGIARHIGIHQGDIKFIGIRQHLPIQLPTAHNDNFIGIRATEHRGFQRIENLGTRRGKIVPTSHHQITAFRQGFGAIDSKVLRPIITGLSSVLALKNFKSSGKCMAFDYQPR